MNAVELADTQPSEDPRGLDRGSSLGAVESGEIVLRILRRDDFGVLGRWLAEPLVRRWWNHEATPEALERDFGASIDGSDATELFLACLSDRPFGLVQRYPIAAYEEYVEELSRLCPVPPGALSIDYLIGEPHLRGRRLGAGMISALLAATWQSCPAANDIIVPVAAGNAASWRALEGAGFARIAEGQMTPDNPVDPPDHYVYAIRRPSRTPSRGAPPARRAGERTSRARAGNRQARGGPRTASGK